MLDFTTPATTEIYPYVHPLSLHDALPVSYISSSPRSPISRPSSIAAARKRSPTWLDEPQNTHSRRGRRDGEEEEEEEAVMRSSLAPPRCPVNGVGARPPGEAAPIVSGPQGDSCPTRSDEHTSELQSIMRI